MPTYPHTIENGGGERITFLRRVSDATGERLEVENVVSPGGGPPMHVHHLQSEGLTVRHGRLGWQRPGQEPVYAEAGESIVFAAGDPHRFWNAGEGELRCSGFITPPHNVEYFLAALYDSQKRSGGKRPSPFDAAFLATRYRSEFGMLAIPPLVQRILFPLLVAVGRMLGKFDRYADAPQPVRR
jgi:mannose-6-phosphate isomerase-like protein (cupin superfamily)